MKLSPTRQNTNTVQRQLALRLRTGALGTARHYHASVPALDEGQLTFNDGIAD